EARIWNVARTEASIRATMNVQNPQSPLNTGLVARWGLDDGNSSVADSTGSVPTGNILGPGGVPGSGYSWVAGAPLDVAPCEDSQNRSLDFDALKNLPQDYVLLEPL